jgi:hypothetical protein
VRIDATARELRAEQTVVRPLRTVVALRALPEQAAVVLGIRTGPPGAAPFSAPTGFEVVRLNLDPW